MVHKSVTEWHIDVTARRFLVVRPTLEYGSEAWEGNK